MPIPSESDPAQLDPIPDMSVLRQCRRAPPTLPLEVVGPEWSAWISGAAEAAACPVEYVAAPLLASVSALIGNARWARATLMGGAPSSVGRRGWR